MVSSERHISSVIVRAIPSLVASLSRAISNVEEADVCGHSQDGKIVVVLETTAEQVITHIIDHINSLHGVLNTSLIFHHIEPVAPHQ